MFPLELLADLPNPRDDEPASLRIDIVDELTDHLHCAFRREVLKDGDEAAARRRTLDRFGDPKQLARQLWWQAMWSRIMKQRIVSVLQWSVAVLAMLISGAVLWQQSQMLAEIRQARQEESVQRQALVAKIDKLQLPATSPQAPGGLIQLPPVTLADTPVTPQDFATPINPPTPAESEERRQLDEIYDPTEERPRRNPVRVMPNDEAQDPALPTYGDSDAFNPAGPPPSQPPRFTPQSTEPAQVTVKLVLETKDGRPLRADNVSIVDRKGAVYHGDPRFIMRPVSVTVTKPDGTTAEDTIGALDEAKYEFQGLEPDHYDLKIVLNDHQYSQQSLLIRDDKPQEVTVVCPAPRRRATLRVTMPPLPEDLQPAAHDVGIWIEPQPIVLDGVQWNPSKPLMQELRFDPKTGAATELCQTFGNEEPYTSIDLRKSKEEDRLVFLPTGPVGIYYVVNVRKGQYGDRIHYPSAFEGGSALLMRNVEAGENHWKIELPEQLLALARASKERMESEEKYGPVAPVAYPTPDVVEPPPRDDKTAQLTVTLVPESKTGRVSKAQVTLKSAEALHVSAPVEGADPAQFKFHALDTGYYELEVRLPDGQVCTRPLLVENEEPRELTIVCPGRRQRLAMELTLAPLPEKIRELGFEHIEMYVWAGPLEVGKSQWTSSNRMAQKIRFDARTGTVRSIEVAGGQRHQNIDLTTAPDDERRVFLPVGGVGYGFEASGGREDPERMYLWPNGLNTESNDGLKHTVEPGEKSWKLELPQKYLDELLEAGKRAQAFPRSG